MSEFRQNFITKEWVVIATDRAKRPDTFRGEEEEKPILPAYKADCPFCPGNETQTTEETYSKRENDIWSVRVVRNKYAALSSDQLAKREHEGKFLKSYGYGVAEVVVETSRHDLTLALMPVEYITEILKAMLIRFHAISLMQNISLITLFKNFGRYAGGTYTGRIDALLIDSGKATDYNNVHYRTFWLKDSSRIQFNEGDYVIVSPDKGTGLWCMGRKTDGISDRRYAGKVDLSDVKTMEIGGFEVGSTICLVLLSALLGFLTIYTIIELLNSTDF